MDIPIDAVIECTNGPAGRSTAIILDPIKDQVTHVVVREPGLLGVEYMAPIDFVIESTPHVIRLRCTSEELTHMPPFISTHFIPPVPGLVGSYGMGTMFWPYVGLQSGIAVDQENTLPEGLAIHRGSHVHATDGHIGEVEEFLINPADSGITHVVLREGHFWDRQNVTIPIKNIDHIDDDIVYLTLNKQQIEKLPAIAVQRRPN
jgi:sporulation protein YlmC with PRC-barrel domain